VSPIQIHFKRIISWTFDDGSNRRSNGYQTAAARDP
jgi:hypothetical protein